MEENPPQTAHSQDSPEARIPETPAHKIPVIRTYEHDIEEAIAQKKISSASISIAEADARRKHPVPVKPAVATEAVPSPAPIIPVEPRILPPISAIPTQILTPPPTTSPTAPPPHTVPRAAAPIKKSHSRAPAIVKVIVSLILICAGIYGGYYLYTISPLSKESAAPVPAPVAENNTIPSIVTPDSQKIIDITGLTGQEIISTLRQETNIGASNATSSNATAAGKTGMLGLVFQETTSGLTTQVTAPQFIAQIGMNPPDAFTSSLNDAWMFGADNSAPFIIFTTNFFQNTFAGMLAWEPTLPLDLGSLFGFNIATAGKYEDRILDNKNIREFVNASGTPVFLYGFTDNATLVLARNERAFSDIVGRIEKQTYVR